MRKAHYEDLPTKQKFQIEGALWLVFILAFLLDHTSGAEYDRWTYGKLLLSLTLWVFPVFRLFQMMKS